MVNTNAHTQLYKGPYSSKHPTEISGVVLWSTRSRGPLESCIPMSVGVVEWTKRTVRRSQMFENVGVIDKTKRTVRRLKTFESVGVVEKTKN
ncbi:hypothetical protein CEXT_338911 [Caerostris extrusa]|uniref:Uncharacterized protein n=1 Tax=Caerostris extrusa TaxID=172846 RepID=A0AAV4XJM7_CAEEX|nr:hypothetical protein CEXT_338911 [Caerostris extrusa]